MKHTVMDYRGELIECADDEAACAVRTVDVDRVRAWGVEIISGGHAERLTPLLALVAYLARFPERVENIASLELIDSQVVNGCDYGTALLVTLKRDWDEDTVRKFFTDHYWENDVQRLQSGVRIRGPGIAYDLIHPNDEEEE